MVAGFAGFAVLSLAGCGGKPFNVKPRPEVPQAEISSGDQTQIDGVRIQAEPVTDEDFLYATFDANLILAGLLPVRVKLTNESQESISLNKAKFRIKTSGGKEFKSKDARSAYKQLISFYDISTYTKSGYRQAREDFASYALDTKSPLESGESRQGMIFFKVLPETAGESGLALSVERLNAKQSKSKIELKLN